MTAETHYTPREIDLVHGRALAEYAARNAPPPDPRRASYIDGLRALADVLEEHGTLQLPYEGDSTAITTYFLSGDDPRSEMAATARAYKAAGVKWAKNVRDDGDGTGVFMLRGQLHGLKLELTAYRNAVCTRVVTGTREVTETVKDPDALAAVPEIKVTRTVEDARWECHSLLAPSEDAAEVTA